MNLEQAINAAAIMGAVNSAIRQTLNVTLTVAPDPHTSYSLEQAAERMSAFTT